MDLYEILHEVIHIDKDLFFGYVPVYIEEEYVKLLSPKEKKQFEYIRIVLSMHMNVSQTEVNYTSTILRKNDGKTYDQDTFLDEAKRILDELNYDLMPIVVKARLTDFLWVNYKSYKHANIAISAYKELFEMWFSYEDWYTAIKIMDRLICITMQINDQNTREECIKILLGHIKSIDKSDNSILSIRLIERILNTKFEDLEFLIDHLNRIISSNQNNVNKIESALKLKKRCYELDKKLDLAIQASLELADYYVNYVLSMDRSDFQTVIISEKYLIKAIVLYKNNGKVEEAEKIQKKLIDIQRKKPAFMNSIFTTFDTSKLSEYIDKSFLDLSFQEAIIRLTQFTIFQPYDSVKQKVLGELSTSLIANMFPKSRINEYGQTIVNLRPLDLSDIDKNEELVNQHIHKMYYDMKKIEGDIILKKALYYIENNYEFDESMLDFLVANNGIVPEEREKIFKTALCLGLKGKYYEALHILVPQVENLFRKLAKSLGGVTIKMGDDGITNEKTLGHIFCIPELVEGYDENLLFIFKGLMIEKISANLRNEIAHGLLNEKSAYSGACIYFICATIKLLSFTSTAVYKIYQSSDKLKMLEDPGESIIPTRI